MKKIYILFLIIFLTGCSAKYNLTIDNKHIIEEVNINIPKDYYSYDEIEPRISNDIFIYDGLKDKYEMTRKNNSYDYITNYKFEHDIDNYSKSYFLGKCYPYNFIKNTDDTFSFAANSPFKCINMDNDEYMDEVEINIKTDLTVLDNNADEVNGNTYTWLIDYDNYETKSVFIKIQKEKKENDKIKENISQIIIVIAITALILTIIIVTYKIRKKMDTNNQL